MTRKFVVQAAEVFGEPTEVGWSGGTRQCDLVMTIITDSADESIGTVTTIVQVADIAPLEGIPENDAAV